MKHFGTVQSFDERSGHGSIKPESGGRELGFERAGILREPMVSPRVGLRLSYNLIGDGDEAQAIRLETISSERTVSPQKPLSIFRSAAEEAAMKAEHSDSAADAGHMSSTEGHVVSTPEAVLPYKVILEHEGLADTERSFATMRKGEAFIRRNTPRPLSVRAPGGPEQPSP